MSPLDSKTKHFREQLLQWLFLFCAAVGIVTFTSFQLVWSDAGNVSFSILFLGKNTNVFPYNITLVGIFFLLYRLKKFLFSPLGFIKFICILLLSVFFSLFSVLSVYFNANLSVSLLRLLTSAKSLFSFFTAFCGGVLLFFAIIRLIWYVGEHFHEMKLTGNRYLEKFFGEHLWRNSIIAIAICWLPQYIIRFPGVVPYDGWQSIAMHLGYTEITTQHPLIWGALVGYLTELGTVCGINWLAPLVLCLIQHILCVLAVTYTVSTLKKLGFHTWFLAGTLTFFIILPPMSLYASTLYNDCFYCLSIMLLTIEIVYYLYDRKTYFLQRRHLLLTALAVFGTIFRYNGLYTMLAVIAVVALRELILLVKHKVKFTQAAVLVILCLILPLSCGQVLQSSLNKAFDAKEIRTRAMLAMPIQQSVRCLITYGDSIPKEDYDALHAVLTWSDEEYAENYDPRNFDGVKESFKTDATGEEMSAFLKAWLNLVVNYPKTCFMATANQTYYLFSPLVNNVRYYESISAHASLAMPRYNFDPDPYVIENPVLSLLCRALRVFETSVFPNIPFLGLIVNPAAYTILLFSICLSVLFRKDRRVLILTAALLVTLGITFLGPAVYNHPRYIYPIMYCMPILISAFLLPKEEKTPAIEVKSEHKKVGVITFHDYDNYGALLQSYALQICLKKLDAQPEIINYNCEYISNPFQLKRLKNKGLFNYIYGAIGYICYLPRKRKFNAFRKQMCYSQRVTKKTIGSMDGKYNVYIAGSDQIWDYHLTDFDKTYFLDFVTKGKKCSYAASIGEHLPAPEYRQDYTQLLQRFDHILMRESYGADVVEQLIGTKPDCACDPTLLLTGEQWEALMAKPKKRKDYILVYQLGINPSFVKFVKRLKKQTGLPVVYIPFPLVGLLSCSMQIAIGPKEWLRLFHDAKYVVTDSFHGAVFSILFHKPFFVRVDGHHVNRRVEELLTRLNMTDRIIRDTLENDAITAPVDYTYADRQLQSFREESLKKLAQLLDLSAER